MSSHKYSNIIAQFDFKIDFDLILNLFSRIRPFEYS